MPDGWEPLPVLSRSDLPSAGAGGGQRATPGQPGRLSGPLRLVCPIGRRPLAAGGPLGGRRRTGWGLVRLAPPGERLWCEPCRAAAELRVAGSDRFTAVHAAAAPGR